jgi:hypothetical protein
VIVWFAREFRDEAALPKMLIGTGNHGCCQSQRVEPLGPPKIWQARILAGGPPRIAMIARAVIVLPGQILPHPAAARVSVGPVWLKRWLIVCVFERDTEPVVFSPYDTATPTNLIGVHDQREFVGNG